MHSPPSLGGSSEVCPSFIDIKADNSVKDAHQKEPLPQWAKPAKMSPCFQWAIA